MISQTFQKEGINDEGDLTKCVNSERVVGVWVVGMFWHISETTERTVVRWGPPVTTQG